MGDDFPTAEQKLGLDKVGATLDELMKANKALAAAWARGVELYTVRSMAISGSPLEEIAEALGMTKAEFERMVKADHELQHVWNQARIQHLRTLRTGLTKSAVKGNQKALETIERMIKHDAPRSVVDPLRLPVDVAANFLGVSRQSLNTWNAKLGAPRNGDGTVNLPDTVAWRIEHERSRLSGRGGKGPSAADELHQERLRRFRRENDVEEGRLVWLDQVIVTIIALESAIVSVLENQPRAFASELPGKTAAEIEQAVVKHNGASRLMIHRARINRDPIPKKYAGDVRAFLDKLLHRGGDGSAA